MTPRDALAAMLALLWVCTAAVMLATALRIEAHRPDYVQPDTPVLDTLYGVAVPRLTASLERGSRAMAQYAATCERVGCRAAVRVRWDLAQAVD